MKKIIIITVSLFFGNYVNSQINVKLKELSKAHCFVEMDSINNMSKGADYYFYKGLFANVCNNPKLSNQYLDSLKDKTLKNSFEFLKLKNDNYVKTFNYHLALQTSKELTSKFVKHYSEEELKDELNTQKIWKVLDYKPVQNISKFSNATLTTKKDKVGFTTIKVNGNGVDTSFVFDTGAGLNCISESIAKKYALQIIPNETVAIQSFTGQMCEVKVGIAPMLKIGDIIIENSVFIVYPDSAFSFSNGAYVINGIIGFPIIKELGTITIEKGLLTFSKLREQTVEVRNLFVDQLRAIVTLKFNGKLHPYNFDSGGKTSLFNKSFYEAYKDYIDSNGTLSIRNESGAGGNVITKEVVELKDQEIFLNSCSIKLKKMSVDKDSYGIYGKVNYGNIGQDVLSQFKKVVISFDNSYLKLEY